MASNPDEFDGAAGEGFPPAERKVVTQSYDLAVQTLDEKWRAEDLVLPSIQREYVWDNPRASRLIESLLLNIPIPVLYFAETESGKWGATAPAVGGFGVAPPTGAVKHRLGS